MPQNSTPTHTMTDDEFLKHLASQLDNNGSLSVEPSNRLRTIAGKVAMIDKLIDMATIFAPSLKFIFKQASTPNSELQA